MTLNAIPDDRELALAPLDGSSSSPRTAWVVSLESKISSAGSCPVRFFQWSANAMTPTPTYPRPARTARSTVRERSSA
jgi:hypothetical protein